MEDRIKHLIIYTLNLIVSWTATKFIQARTGLEDHNPFVNGFFTINTAKVFIPFIAIFLISYLVLRKLFSKLKLNKKFEDRNKKI